MSFIMIFIKRNKIGQLVPYKIREEIAFMLLEEFFNSLDYIEKDVVWCLFEIKDLNILILLII